MSKMIIMQGLPASGKSTRAEKLMRLDGNAVRINKDLLRTMLHFDKWNGRNEDMTRRAATMLATLFLGDEKTVIIDDTNLNEKTLQGWKDKAKSMDVKIQYEVMDTSVDECILRDERRQKKVGKSVIVGMAMQNGLYPKPEKGFVLCDLDGTLCNIEHRLHYVQKPEGEKKDWKAFFEGIPNDEVRYDVLGILAGYVGNGYEIVLMSARPETYRAQTEDWLGNMVPYRALFMRRENDKRPDTEVKSDLLASHFKDLSQIHAVVDDRPSVIRMWREKGLNVIDVGKGIEF